MHEEDFGRSEQGERIERLKRGNWKDGSKDTRARSRGRVKEYEEEEERRKGKR